YNVDYYNVDRQAARSTSPRSFLGSALTLYVKVSRGASDSDSMRDTNADRHPDRNPCPERLRPRNSWRRRSEKGGPVHGPSTDTGRGCARGRTSAPWQRSEDSRIRHS